MPSLTEIEQWPVFTVDRPLRMLVSACITGSRCGSDGSAYGAPYAHTERLLAMPNVVAVPFCPEDVALGTPRDVPDIHGGDGFDVLDGRARLVTSKGRDCTEEMLAAAHAMLDLAQRERVGLALLMDISAACGSQVIYVGDRSGGVYQRARGVCAALLARNCVPIVSQRDFKTLAAIVHKLDPEAPPTSDAVDHHETDWYRTYFLEGRDTG